MENRVSDSGCIKAGFSRRYMIEDVLRMMPVRGALPMTDNLLTSNNFFISVSIKKLFMSSSCLISRDTRLKYPSTVQLLVFRNCEEPSKKGYSCYAALLVLVNHSRQVPVETLNPDISGEHTAF